MASTSTNVILKEVRGTFGKQVVFRQRNGKTVLCNMPRPYPPKTAKQLANQERFARANAFAKAVIADPVRKAEYQARAAKPGVSAYHVAFQEAFHGAEIKEVQVSEKVIKMRMRNNNGVREVRVDDKPAVSNKEMQVWEYIMSGGEREIRAFDKMGRCWVRKVDG